MTEDICWTLLEPLSAKVMRMRNFDLKNEDVSTRDLWFDALANLTACGHVGTVS